MSDTCYFLWISFKYFPNIPSNIVNCKVFFIVFYLFLISYFQKYLKVAL